MRHRFPIRHPRNRHCGVRRATPRRSCSPASAKSFRYCARFAQPKCASSASSPTPAPCVPSSPTSASPSVHPPLPRRAARRFGTCAKPRPARSTPRPNPLRVPVQSADRLVTTTRKARAHASRLRHPSAYPTLPAGLKRSRPRSNRKFVTSFRPPARTLTGGPAPRPFRTGVEFPIHT